MNSQTIPTTTGHEELNEQQQHRQQDDHNDSPNEQLQVGPQHDDDNTDHDDRAVLLFYRYFQNVQFLDPIGSVERLAEYQKRLCHHLKLLGRILIAQEGVNGTLSGHRSDIESYIQSMENYREDTLLVAEAPDNEQSNNNTDKTLLFSSVDWKVSDATTDKRTSNTIASVEPFPDLKVSIVKEIVSTGGLVNVDDLCETGNHMTPEEFHEALEQQSCRGSDSSTNEAATTITSNHNHDDNNNHSNDIALIDVRNTFEHNIGHFMNPVTGEKAMDPHMVTFSSFDKFCQDNRQQLQHKKVLMYCTGGIRCEKASVMMKRHGIHDVHQLSGGIHRYLEKYGSQGHFKGLNFTFDKRVAIQPTAATTTDKEASSYEVVGRCVECTTSFDELCGSRVCTVCRDLVLVCLKCQQTLREYHCQRHSMWKSCYFTFLEIFDRDELVSHKQQLLTIRDMTYAPTIDNKYKNIRRTLSRQIEKIDRRIHWMDDNNRTSGEKDAPRRCRTCMEPRTICDGRCWGFWKTDGHDNQRVGVPERSADDVESFPLPSRPVPIAVGDRVQPGIDWNTIRLGDKYDSSGSIRKGVVVEIKSWASSDHKDCVAVMWDDMTGVRQRNTNKIQPQIYRWAVLASDGSTLLYDVCKDDEDDESKSHKT